MGSIGEVARCARVVLRRGEDGKARVRVSNCRSGSHISIPIRRSRSGNLWNHKLSPCEYSNPSLKKWQPLESQAESMLVVQSVAQEAAISRIKSEVHVSIPIRRSRVKKRQPLGSKAKSMSVCQSVAQEAATSGITS